MSKQKKIVINKKLEKTQVEKYPLVEVHWLDIVGEAGWQTIDQVHKNQLGRCVTKGHLLSRSKGVTRIFADYGLKDGAEGDAGHIESVGNTTVIPNSVITKIRKL